MPARIRHNPLGSGLSVTDLPILPFLAPRLLQPWPVPMRDCRGKGTKKLRQEHGVEVERSANGCLKSSQARPRTTGGQRCLRERARAATPVLLSRRPRHSYGSEARRKAYSTGPTATPIRDHVPEVGVPRVPRQPLEAGEKGSYMDMNDTSESRQAQNIDAAITPSYAGVADPLPKTPRRKWTDPEIQHVGALLDAGYKPSAILEVFQSTFPHSDELTMVSLVYCRSRILNDIELMRQSRAVAVELGLESGKWPKMDEILMGEEDRQHPSEEMLGKATIIPEVEEIGADDAAALEWLRDEVLAGERDLEMADGEARRGRGDRALILDETTADLEPRPSQRPEYSEFPLLIQAWDFMVEAAKGKAGLTIPFSRHWRTWFGNYHAKLVEQKLERSKQYAKMEDDAMALLRYDHELEIEEIRKLWLKFLNWRQVEVVKGTDVRHKELYVRRIDVSSLLAEGGEEAVKGRKAMAEDRWPEIMMNILAQRPEDGLDFLVATCVGPLSHRLHYSDVIDHLIKYYMGTTVDPKTDLATFRDDFDHLFDSIMTLLQKYKDSEVGISDFALSRLFRHASFEQADALYSALLARGKRMGINTRFSVAEALGRRGATDIAIRILESLHGDRVSFKLPHVESVCATVLRGSQRDPGQKIGEGEAFERLLKLGIQPRINFYNILAHNAIESGDHETAWKVYDMLIENGIEPSPFTYSLLLNDAKWRGDHEALNYITEVVKERDVRNEYMASDIIHATWLMDEQRRRALRVRAPVAKMERVAFHKVMFLYKQYFEVGPFLDFAPDVFKVLRPDYKGFSQEVDPQHGKKMHPDVVTLNLMINIAIKCRADRVWSLYERWKELLEQGHPDFVRVAKSGTAVMDAFIKKLGEHPKTLPLCMHVMTDMLAAQETWSPDGGNVTDPELVAEKRTLKHANRNLTTGKVDLPSLQPVSAAQKLPFAKPSVKTWTVLLQAFMEQGQPKAARRVLDMMTARGVVPDQVTWEQLVLGHANMKDEEATVDAMVKAGNAGFSIDGSVLDRMGGPVMQRGIMEQVIRRVQGTAKAKDWSYEPVTAKEQDLPATVYGRRRAQRK